MNNLVPINTSTINDEPKQTVNARDLHKFLESKQQFSDWIKGRINQFEFSEDQDFILVHKIMEQVSGSKHLIDYYITLDMAKELSMVERNFKGKQARQYFIECERKTQQSLTALPNFTDPAEAAIAWANEYKAKQLALEEIRQKEEVIEYQQPAVEFVQKYVSLDSCKTIREVAKVLDQPERNFINWLIHVKVLFRQNGELLPYAKYQQRGYFEVKTGVHSKHTYVHTVFTSQGVTWIAKKVDKWLKEH